MIRLTNKYNLPEALVNAVKVDRHPVAGNISATELWKAPQIRQLKKMYDLEEDVMDRIWSLLGTATHAILERASLPSFQIKYVQSIVDHAYDMLNGDISEEDSKRISALVEEVLWFAGKAGWESQAEDYLVEHTMCVEVAGMSLYGTPDKLQKSRELLSDFKVTSAWVAVFASEKIDWISQLNTYAWMFRLHSHKVSRAQIIAIFRDWQRARMRENEDYPRKHAGIIPIHLYSNSNVEKRIIERAELHRAVDAGEIPAPPCTPQDQWAKSDVFAVRKKKAKRAKRLFDTKIEAADYMSRLEDPKHYTIDHRKGEKTFCETFCPVRDFCPQRKKENETT